MEAGAGGGRANIDREQRRLARDRAAGGGAGTDDRCPDLVFRFHHRQGQTFDQGFDLPGQQGSDILMVPVAAIDQFRDTAGKRIGIDAF